jgi:hypothetical protein
MGPLSAVGSVDDAQRPVGSPSRVTCVSWDSAVTSARKGGSGFSGDAFGAREEGMSIAAGRRLAATRTHELAELDAVEESLSPGSTVLSDNAHESDALSSWSLTKGRSFPSFAERPEGHRYPGDGIGASWLARATGDAGLTAPET